MLSVNANRRNAVGRKLSAARNPTAGKAPNRPSSARTVLEQHRLEDRRTIRISWSPHSTQGPHRSPQAAATAHYAPLQPNGYGIQSVYLTEVTQEFAEVLAGLTGSETASLIGTGAESTPMHTNDDLDFWEHNTLKPTSRVISRYR